MQFAEHEICQVADNVWNTVLGLHITMNHNPAPVHDNTDLVSCSVIVHTPQWEGEVHLQCSEEMARRAASIMFEKNIESITDDLMKDAIGELTNITSGNIKLMLPDPGSLSIPSVKHNGATINDDLSRRLISCVVFECEKEPLLISIHQVDEYIPSPSDGGKIIKKT